jgi:signal peptidase II
VAEQPTDGTLADAPGKADLSGESVRTETSAQVDAVESAPARPGSRRAIIVLVAVAVVAFVLDLVSKQLVVAHLREGEPVRWLGGAVYLTYIRNGGAAFSFGTGYTWIFPVITVFVIAGIAVLARTLRSVAWAVSFGLVLGGAFGNLGDRLFRAPGPMRGHVVDFVSLFSSDGAHFAIFNLADSALSCGVALALLLELMGRHRDGTRAQAAAPSADPADSARLTA